MNGLAPVGEGGGVIWVVYRCLFPGFGFGAWMGVCVCACVFVMGS